jgi:hypothetical protein
LGGKRLADSQAMDELPYDGLILFNQSASRKYLNAAERQRFIEAARGAPPKIQLSLRDATTRP